MENLITYRTPRNDYEGRTHFTVVSQIIMDLHSANNSGDKELCDKLLGDLSVFMSVWEDNQEQSIAVFSA